MKINFNQDITLNLKEKFGQIDDEEEEKTQNIQEFTGYADNKSNAIKQKKTKSLLKYIRYGKSKASKQKHQGLQKVIRQQQSNLDEKDFQIEEHNTPLQDTPNYDDPETPNDFENISDDNEDFITLDQSGKHI